MASRRLTAVLSTKGLARIDHYLGEANSLALHVGAGFDDISPGLAIRPYRPCAMPLLQLLQVGWQLEGARVEVEHLHDMVMVA